MRNIFKRRTNTPPKFIKTPYTAALKVIGIATLTCILLNPNSLLRFANDLPVGTFRDAMVVGSASLSEALKPMGVNSYLQKKRETFFAQSKMLKPSICVANQTSPAQSESQTQTPGGAKDGRAPASVGSAATEKTGRYLLLGDSLLKTILEHQMKSAMNEVTPHAQVETVAAVGGGITRPDIVDWVKTTESFESQGHYDVAFVFLGTNDMQGIHQDGHAYRFGTDSWKKRYNERVKIVLNNLCSYTKKVYWVPPPPVRDEELQSSIKTVTDLVAEYLPTYASERVAFGLPKCIEYVSSYPALAPDNHFTAFLKVGNEDIKIRERDGIHLTNEGAKILTDYLMKISGLKPEAHEALEAHKGAS